MGPRRCGVPGVGGSSDREDGEGNRLLAALGLGRGEAAEVLHQHLMARRLADPSGLPSAATLANVLRIYAMRKAAFGELVRQDRLPPGSPELP